MTSMCHTQVSFILVLPALSFFASQVVGEELKPQASLVQKLSTAQAPDVRETNDALLALLQQSTYDQLQELVVSEYDSVALFAAWERVRRDCEHALAKAKSGRRRAICRLHIERFAGLLEGRLASRIPSWWLADLRIATPTLSDERTSERSRAKSKPVRVIAFNFSRPIDYSGYENMGNNLYVDKSLHGRLVGDSLVLRPDQSEFIISSSLRNILGASKNMTGALALVGESLPDGSLVLTAHGAYHGEEGYVLLLGSGTDNVRWRSVVAGDTPSGGYSGHGLYKRVMVCVDDTRVIVFGGGVFGIYVESFALKDGTCLLRFFTSGLYTFEKELPPYVGTTK